MKKKRGFIVLLFILIFILAQTASAEQVKWGTTYFSEDWHGDTLRGHIDWWVYDDPADVSFDPPGDGTYIYIYQIENHTTSDDVIAYFSILGLDDNNVSGIDSVEDPGGTGAEPYEEYVSDTDGAVWKWTDEEVGYRYIQLDDHSWGLVLTSDFGPVVRDFEVRGIDDGVPLEGPDVPEPSVIALFGVGSTILYAKRKKGKSA